MKNISLFPYHLSLVSPPHSHRISDVLLVSLELFVLFFIISSTVGYSFVFSFYNNELYIMMEDQLSDRGYQVIWGLLQLQIYCNDLSKSIPNVIAHLDNTDTDQKRGRQLAFWRFVGDENTILWPEHDYWGWQSSWQAPYPVYEEAITQGNVAWDKRRHAIYWSGDTDLSNVRKAYKNCALAHKKIIIQTINWPTLRNNRKDLGSFNDRNDMKPIFMDSRKRLQYKYNIYLWGLQWSSALKRILPTGSALIIPTPNPHETVVTRLLDKYCKDCFYSVPYSDHTISKELCEGLEKILSNSTKEFDNQSKEMGKKLRIFSRDHLNLNSTLEYMYDTLYDLSNSQQKTSKYKDNNFLVEFKKLKLEKYTCHRLLTTHLNPNIRPEDNKTRWQYEQWYYDSNCRIKLDSTYLQYTAI